MEKESSAVATVKPKIRRYTDLIIWQKSHELVINIYELVQSFPQSENYNLISQIRRAGLSVPTNIVEGFSRWNQKDSLKFYNYSDASLSELNYLFYLSKDLGYISESQFNVLNEKMDECTKLLRGWIKSIRSRKDTN